MNLVKITLKSGEPITLRDSEKMAAEELSERLSSLFSINNIAILKTDNTSIILRPSDISSISVEELVEEKDTPKTEVEPPSKKESEVVDIITDID